MHDTSCFITLTYNNEHLPSDWSLKIRDWQLFMKRLNKEFGYGVRYFHAGEYGEQCGVCREPRRKCECAVFSKDLGRPHFHAILFGVGFLNDRTLWKVRKGKPFYISPTLDRLWSDSGDSMGYHSISEVTFESCAYVARYCTKKVNGDGADSHYTRGSLHRDGSWSIDRRRSEYTTQSKGIGLSFLKAFLSDIYPRDYVLFNNRRIRPPRYYDKKCEQLWPDLWARVKSARIDRSIAGTNEDDTVDRLTVREQIQLNRFARLVRHLG